jgi:hypothetical protein
MYPLTSIPMLQQIIDLMSHPVAGILVGVFGLLLAYRWKTEVRPFSTHSYGRWFSAESRPHPELTIQFRGVDVEAVGWTNIRFWNAGNKTIRKADFSRSHPLQICVPEGVTVLDAKVIRTTPKELAVSLETSTLARSEVEQAIAIDFEFLEPSEGFILQVVHDGSSTKGPKLIGRLAGAGNLRSARETETLNYLRFSIGAVGSMWIKIVLVPILLTFGSLGFANLYSLFTTGFDWKSLFSGVSIVYFVFAYSLLFSKVIPRGL